MRRITTHTMLIHKSHAPTAALLKEKVLILLQEEVNLHTGALKTSISGETGGGEIMHRIQPVLADGEVTKVFKDITELVDVETQVE